MVILYKDPDGKKIFDTSNNGFETTVAVNDMELEKHCTELETRLSKYEASECCLSTLILHTCSNIKQPNYKYT